MLCCAMCMSVTEPSRAVRTTLPLGMRVSTPEDWPRRTGPGRTGDGREDNKSGLRADPPGPSVARRCGLWKPDLMSFGPGVVAGAPGRAEPSDARRCGF